MNSKRISIITIICFCSLILIPIGLVLMFFYTNWSKKLKIILASVLSIVYIGGILLILNLKPANNSKGVSVPGLVNQGSTEFETPSFSKKSKERQKDFEKNNLSIKSGDSENLEKGVQLPAKVNSNKSKISARIWYTLLFFVFMLVIIILQNLKNKKNTGFENPYVDSNLYKFPLNKNTKWPTVHFLKIERNENEQFYFATPGKHNIAEGDILITNRRFIFLGKNSDENLEFEIPELDTAISVSSSCFLLTRGDKKFYFFVDESQLKIALNVLRFVAGECV